MAEPICQAELTRDEQCLIALLRQGPQSVAGLAGALQTSAGHLDDVLQGLARKVGLVPLCRYDTLRYGLAEYAQHGTCRGRRHSGIFQCTINRQERE